MKEKRAAADNADVDSNRSESEESDSGDGGMAGRIAFVDDCISVDTAGCVGVEVHDDSSAVKRKSIENISAIPEHVMERVSNDCGHMLSSEYMEETVCCACKASCVSACKASCVGTENIMTSLMTLIRWIKVLTEFILMW